MMALTPTTSSCQGLYSQTSYQLWRYVRQVPVRTVGLRPSSTSHLLRISLATPFFDTPAQSLQTRNCYSLFVSAKYTFLPVWVYSKKSLESFTTLRQLILTYHW